MTPPRFCSRCGAALTSHHDGERERLRCADDACGFVHYDNPTPVVAALVEHEGEILLVRNHGWPETWFGLVSGFLERDETPEDAILRELREELGLDGEIAAWIGAYAFPQRNEVLLCWHVIAQGEVTLGPELADLRRVPPHRLRPWPFGTGHAVRDWLARRQEI